jgi:hypothetical protein
LFGLAIKFAKTQSPEVKELFGKFLKKTLHLEEESYEIAKLLGGFGHSFSINYHKSFSIPSGTIKKKFPYVKHA